ncbi:MAG: hypothetical protein ABIO71_13630 [Caldimonas sp.]
MQAVSANDVQRYAAANFAPASRRVAVAGESAAFAAELRAARPASMTIAAEGLDLERLQPMAGR